MAQNVIIGGELESRGMSGIIADSHGIVYRTENGDKRQDVINKELSEKLDIVYNKLFPDGSGGSSGAPPLIFDESAIATADDIRSLWQ